MANFADSFLADLEDLSDDEPEMAQQLPQDDLEDKIDDIETLNYDDLKRVAKLTSDPHYHDIVQRVKEAVANSDPMEVDAPRVGSLEDDPTYKLLVECNKLAVDIDNEIVLIHNYIRDKYRPKFPELESLVLHAVDYARVVKRIGNETDLTLINLDDQLPAATVMVVTVTATTTAGKPLTPDGLQKTMDACDMALQLDEDKRTIINFVEGRMHRIAPNLSEVVGSEVAAQLMGVAGGLLPLSCMPACNVMVLGARRKVQGLTSHAVQPHQGFVYNSSTVQQTPPALRARAARLLANKCTLIARVDAYGQDPTGATGEKMRQEVLAKIEKWQEPPPAKTVKPLPCPDAEKKKRRGGKRFRKMRERYGMTDVRKAVNKMMFNTPEEEYIDGDEVVGLGVLGAKEGTGRLRMVARQQKLKLTAKTQKKYAKQLAGGMSTMKSGGASTIKSGLTSSLAFTPIQGFELENPNRALDEDSKRSGLESYFSERSGFRSIKQL